MGGLPLLVGLPDALYAVSRDLAYAIKGSAENAPDQVAWLWTSLDKPNDIRLTVCVDAPSGDPQGMPGLRLGGQLFPY